MYSRQEVMKGIRNPYLIKRNLKKAGFRVFDRIVNEANYITQTEPSQYALVMNKGAFMTDRWGVACNPFLADEYIDRFDPVIVSSQRIYDRHKESIDYIFSFIPGHTAPIIEFEDDHRIICVLSADQDGQIDSIAEYVTSRNIDYLLSTYYDPVKYYYPDIDDDTLIYFPWCVPSEYVVDSEAITYRGSDSIAIFGAKHPDRYPVRNWCREFSFVDDYDYAHYNKAYVGADYYKWLRQFDATIAAGSDSPEWSWLVAKYFEIPASGSLLFAHECMDLERAGFDQDNCVLFTKEDFEEKAHDYLTDPESYIDRRRAGADLIRHKHTVSHRIDTIARLFSA